MTFGETVISRTMYLLLLLLLRHYFNSPPVHLLIGSYQDAARPRKGLVETAGNQCGLECPQDGSNREN